MTFVLTGLDIEAKADLVRTHAVGAPSAGPTASPITTSA